MIGLCLGLSGAVWAQLELRDFTLAWDHTIEKIRWEEDYHITEEGLVLGEARVKGNGAGMEIPEGARLANGSWRFHRQLPPLQPLKLGRTPQAGDYQLCHAGHCQPMSHWLGPASQARSAVELWSCALQSATDR